MSVESAVFDIREFGAVAGGEVVCTTAIQRAIDAAAGRGGGVVLATPGVYCTGTLTLKDRVTLELQPGAVLRGSPRIEDYPAIGTRDGDRHPHHLIAAHGAVSVTIRGGGTIDGNGPAFWHPQKGPRTWIVPRTPRVSPMFEFVQCRDLRLQDITILNSPGWTVHLHCCDEVWIRGVRLNNPLFGPNTDGFDINGCRDVFMSDCLVECGDDAIVLKTSRDSRSCERVVVTNCVIRTNCVALKCGTECWHDFRQITFSNCVVHRSTRAFGLYAFDGGTIEDVAVSNIVCDTNCGFILNRPIHLDLRKRDMGQHRPLEEQKIGAIRNVTVSNFVATTDGRVLMTAADGGRLENIVLRDVTLKYPLVDDPAPTAPGARSAQFSNRSPEARAARGAVVAENVDNLVVSNLLIDWPKGPPPAAWAEQGRIENGGDRQIPPPSEVPPMHAIWGRGLRGGIIDAPLAPASHAGVTPFELTGCDIRVR